MISVVYVSCRWFEESERSNLFCVGRRHIEQQIRGRYYVLKPCLLFLEEYPTILTVLSGLVFLGAIMFVLMMVFNINSFVN